MELLAFVSTAESVSAAVQSGADAVAVRLAFGQRGGLTSEEVYGAARFCRVRGVKLYAELDLRLRDSELEGALLAARTAWLNGCDAIIAGSAGLILLLRRTVPEAPIFAGFTLGLCSADGTAAAAAMGVRRVYLAPQLSRPELAEIRKGSKTDLGLLVHGRLDASYAGQGLAGIAELHAGAAQPELLEEPGGIRPFALPDVCLIYHTAELNLSGAVSLAVDGRDRRPEYVSAVLQLYSRAVVTGKLPDAEEMNVLNAVLPVPGFTDAFFTGQRELSLAGELPAPPAEDSPILSALRRGYLRHEFQRVPVSFTAEASLGKPMLLTAEDDRGNTVSDASAKTELAFHRELSQTTLQTELFKTGGTPFLCAGLKAKLQRGIYVRPEETARSRDKLLAQLMQLREAAPDRSAGETARLPKTPNGAEPPALTVSVLHINQLSERLLELAPLRVYVPLSEVRESESLLAPWLRAEGVRLTAVLPPVSEPASLPALTAQLLNARQLGIDEVEVSELGQALFCRRLGFSVCAGLGIGAVSSVDMAALRAFGFRSAVIWPALTALEASALSKDTEAELIVYGRLPLINAPGFSVEGLSGNYYEGLSSVPDEQGLIMPVTRSDTGAVVWSAKKLYLARRSKEYMNSGFSGVRLCFTTESAGECAKIAERFLGQGTYFPASFMTGNY